MSNRITKPQMLHGIVWLLAELSTTANECQKDRIAMFLDDYHKHYPEMNPTERTEHGFKIWGLIWSEENCDFIPEK